MVFDYYEKLSRTQQRIYRESDAITVVRLNDPVPARRIVTSLTAALQIEHRADTEQACRRLGRALADDLKIRRFRLSVLAARPHDNYGELHGTYQPRHGTEAAKITLWMRTARRKRVVAFRTFLRTFLHEFCHHLDYELFRLADSFHTQGFFKRESSLFRQLVPARELPDNNR